MSGLVQALIGADGLVEFPDAGAARVAVGLAAVATHAGSLAGLARVGDSGFAQAARFMNVEGGGAAPRHFERQLRQSRRDKLAGGNVSLEGRAAAGPENGVGQQWVGSCRTVRTPA